MAVVESSSTSRPNASVKWDSEVVSFLPAAAAICLLNVNLSVSAITTACAVLALAGIIPVLNKFSTPNCFIETLLKGFVLLDERKSHFALLSSRFFFKSQLLDSSPLQAFPHYLPLSLLLCCIDAARSPRSRTKQSSYFFLPSHFGDQQFEALFSPTSTFNFFITSFAMSATSMFFSIMNSVMSSTNTSILRAERFSSPHSMRPATQYTAVSNSTSTPARDP